MSPIRNLGFANLYRRKQEKNQIAKRKTKKVESFRGKKEKKVQLTKINIMNIYKRNRRQVQANIYEVKQDQKRNKWGRCRLYK